MASKTPPAAANRVGTATAALEAAGPEGVVAAHAIRRAQRATTRTARAVSSGDKYRRSLKAEWLTGILLMWIYPFVKPNFADTFNKWISRQLAWTAIFIVLLLGSNGGTRTARLCSAFGGLVLLALLLAPFADDRTQTFGTTILTRLTGMLSAEPITARKPSANTPDWLLELLKRSPRNPGRHDPQPVPIPIPLPA